MLISNKEDEIWRIIHEAIYNGNSDELYSLKYVEKLINSLVSVSKSIGERPPFSNMKDFFCYYSPEGKMEYNSFLHLKEVKNDFDFKEDELDFLLKHTEGEICRLIVKVLNNDPNDPHYSAVYATNQIKCYILISKHLGKSLSYNNVFDFFITHGFSQKQYINFEISRKEESIIYRGTQY